MTVLLNRLGGGFSANIGVLGKFGYVVHRLYWVITRIWFGDGRDKHTKADKVRFVAIYTWQAAWFVPFFMVFEPKPLALVLATFALGPLMTHMTIFLFYNSWGEMSVRSKLDMLIPLAGLVVLFGEIAVKVLFLADTLGQAFYSNWIGLTIPAMLLGTIILHRFVRPWLSWEEVEAIKKARKQEGADLRAKYGLDKPKTKKQKSAKKFSLPRPKLAWVTGIVSRFKKSGAPKQQMKQQRSALSPGFDTQGKPMRDTVEMPVQRVKPERHEERPQAKPNSDRGSDEVIDEPKIKNVLARAMGFEKWGEMMSDEKFRYVSHFLKGIDPKDYPALKAEVEGFGKGDKAVKKVREYISRLHNV